jgi:hypothetical protein
VSNRYWVGGTGTWNTSSTTNWSTSSGGASGASVPTAADSVFFDQAGTYTVTCTGALACNDFTVSAGTVTFANGTGPTWSIAGSVSLVAGTVWTATGTKTFIATSAKTITTNGVNFPGNCTFNGVGGSWTLGSALSTTIYDIVVTNGTFDTSSTGNYSVTCGSLTSSNTNVRTINLNASTVSALSGTTFTTSTSLTFNAGTSQINVTSNNITFAGGGQTFYNVSFTSGAATPAITGANTFNNLTFTGKTAVGVNLITLSANQTINGTLTLGAGTAAAYRTMIASDTIGTQRTLTVNTIASLTDIDFQDIVAAGASGTWSGTRLGNCGGNSNITFPAAKTVYYRQTGSANWGATGSGSWSATSGGALDATMFPLAQDTAVFPAATYPASGSTTTINAGYNIGTIDMSLRTSNTMTLATGSTNPNIYGNWVNGTGITSTGTASLIFAGRATQIITSAGKAFAQALSINSPSGTVQLQDAFANNTTNGTTLTAGTLSLQSYSLTTATFSSSNSNTRTIAFGTGNITCTDTGTAWTTATSTNLTTTGTQVVNVTSTGSTAITVSTGSLSEANSISYNLTGGTYSVAFNGTPSVRNLNFTGFAGTLSAINTTNVYGNLTISTGMTVSASTATLTFAGTSGTQQITTNGKTIDFPWTFNGVGGTFQLQDALTMGSTRTAQLSGGTLDLNGKTFTAGTGFVLTGTSTRNLTFNGGTVVCPAATTTAFNCTNATGLTTTAGTGVGTISMTAATAKSFNNTSGTNIVFNCKLNQGGIGTLTVTGNNTFLDLTNTVNLTTVLFTGGTTNKFTNFNLTGALLNLVTLGSTNTTQATLQKGSTWYMGANSTNGGNNTGLTFSAGGGIDYLNVSYINGTVVSTGYTITADNGTYAVTGQSATILRSKVLSGAYGTYTVSGQSATLLRSKVLSGAYGLYTLTGQDASLKRSRLFDANTGQYALTGQDAIITFGGSPVVVGDQLLIKLRSFTERRRF